MNIKWISNEIRRWRSNEDMFQFALVLLSYIIAFWIWRLDFIIFLRFLKQLHVNNHFFPHDTFLQLKFSIFSFKVYYINKLISFIGHIKKRWCNTVLAIMTLNSNFQNLFDLNTHCITCENWKSSSSLNQIKPSGDIFEEWTADTQGRCSVQLLFLRCFIAAVFCEITSCISLSITLWVAIFQRWEYQHDSESRA